MVTPKAYFSVVACITRFAYRHSTHTQLLLFSGAEERSTKYPRKVRAFFFFILVALQFVAHIHINFSFILASEWLKKEKNCRKNWDAKNLASFKSFFFIPFFFKLYMWGFNFGGLRSFAERRSICSCTNIRTEAAFRMDGKSLSFVWPLLSLTSVFSFCFLLFGTLCCCFFSVGLPLFRFSLSLDWNGNWKFYFNQQRSYPTASFFLNASAFFLLRFPMRVGPRLMACWHRWSACFIGLSERLA